MHVLGREVDQMRKSSSLPALLFCVIVAVGLALAYALYALDRSVGGAIAILGAAFLVAAIVSAAIKVAAPWDRAVLLRLGRFRALRGPGLFGMIPVIDTVAYWIDTRVITSAFKAEKTLTKD